MFVSAVISLPLAVALVSLTLHIDTTPGREHNPGVGVAFLPVVLIWLICFLILVASMTVGLFARWRSRNSN